MATLKDALDSARAETTTVNSVVAYLTSIKTQLDDLLSGVVLAPAVQAGIDELFTFNVQTKTQLDEALAANVPPVEPTSRRR